MTVVKYGGLVRVVNVTENLPRF